MAKRKHPGKKIASAPAPGVRGDTDFDLWLRRGLHELFGEVASEPIPPALLRLLGRNGESQPEPSAGDDHGRST
jgi:hypothetical protein